MYIGSVVGFFFSVKANTYSWWRKNLRLRCLQSLWAQTQGIILGRQPGFSATANIHQAELSSGASWLYCLSLSVCPGIFHLYNLQEVPSDPAASPLRLGFSPLWTNAVPGYFENAVVTHWLLSFCFDGTTTLKGKTSDIYSRCPKLASPLQAEFRKPEIEMWL